MKTAMQELIEDLESTMVRSIFERLEREGHFENALEKEKKQIIATYNVAKAEAKMFTELHTTGTKYYNETYNQNK